jgi:hypothetical protein
MEFLFREIPAPKLCLYDKINELSNKKSFAGVIFFSYIKRSALIFNYLIIILLKKDDTNIHIYFFGGILAR